MEGYYATHSHVEGLVGPLPEDDAPEARVGHEHPGLRDQHDARRTMNDYGSSHVEQMGSGLELSSPHIAPRCEFGLGLTQMLRRVSWAMICEK
jgi:hypothetical protein